MGEGRWGLKAPLEVLPRQRTCWAPGMSLCMNIYTNAWGGCSLYRVKHKLCVPFSPGRPAPHPWRPAPHPWAASTPSLGGPIYPVSSRCPRRQETHWAARDSRTVRGRDRPRVTTSVAEGTSLCFLRTDEPGGKACGAQDPQPASTSQLLAGRRLRVYCSQGLRRIPCPQCGVLLGVRAVTGLSPSRSAAQSAPLPFEPPWLSPWAC